MHLRRVIFSYRWSKSVNWDRNDLETRSKIDNWQSALIIFSVVCFAWRIEAAEDRDHVTDPTSTFVKLSKVWVFALWSGEPRNTEQTFMLDKPVHVLQHQYPYEASQPARRTGVRPVDDRRRHVGRRVATVFKKAKRSGLRQLAHRAPCRQLIRAFDVTWPNTSRRCCSRARRLVIALYHACITTMHDRPTAGCDIAINYTLNYVSAVLVH